MYQNIYVDKFNQRVHLWDDQEGYIQLPLRQYSYGYTKDPRGNKKAIDGKTVRKIKLNRQIREDARDPSKQHLFYETDVPNIADHAKNLSAVTYNYKAGSLHEDAIKVE